MKYSASYNDTATWLKKNVYIGVRAILKFGYFPKSIFFYSSVYFLFVTTIDNFFFFGNFDWLSGSDTISWWQLKASENSELHFS